jgi:hypothetical protein
MSLISCPACAKQVSEMAPNCPNCGHPIARPPSHAAEEEKQSPVLRFVGRCVKYSLILVVLVFVAWVCETCIRHGFPNSFDEMWRNMKTTIKENAKLFG